MVSSLFIFVVFASFCWGSFLNVVGHRLLTDESLLGRSQCPANNCAIAWYDLVPVISWINLRAQCRTCTAHISSIYPFIELLTAIAFVGLWWLPSQYTISYFVFFSALIVSIRTDLESMLISRYATLFLVPVGFILSFCNMLAINPLDSFLGASLGYGLLFTINWIFFRIKKIHGMGQGDMELLAFIGSFTGILGIWATILIGSIFGSIFSLAYLLWTGKNKTTKIPFGPFLAIGAILFVLFKQELIRLFFYL